MKKYLIIIIIVLALTGFGFWYYYSTSNKNVPQENVVQNYNPPVSEISTSTSIENNQAQIFSVDIKNFSFNPQEIKVKVGDKIIWTNQDSVNHIIESDNSGLFASNPLGINQTFEWIANTKGEFSYHCKIHPSMKGKIIVE